MKHLVLFVVISLGAFGVIQNTAQACQCQPPIFPETGYEQADAVFRGWVVDISPLDNPYGVIMYDITIVVTGYWKGSINQYTHVSICTESGCCGYEGFVVSGEEYLIYATNSLFEVGPDLEVTVCNRTQPIIGAGDDLDYLGPPQTVPVEGKTWGAVKAIYHND